MLFEFGVNSRNAVLTGGGRVEVARLLRKVADEVEAGGDGGDLMDINGNSCGSWFVDDERPDFEDCEASDLFQLADDYAIRLDDDPRQMTRAQLVEGLESICVACYDEERNNLLAEAYGDSMLAGDLPGDCSDWRKACRRAWEQEQ